MAETGPAGVGDLAVKLFDILKQEPLIALVAITFAVLIVFTTMFMNKLGPLGKVLIAAFMGLCLMILGLGTYILFFPPGNDGNALKPIKASLQVRLNSKGQRFSGRVKGKSQVTIDKGELFQLRVQNQALPGSWKDKMRLVGQRPDTLFVTITNRREVECRVSQPIAGADAPLDDEFEAPPVGMGPGRPRFANTTFEIDLSEAYTNDAQVELELEYQDSRSFKETDGRLRGDLLIFKQWDGLDHLRIVVTPQHDETISCLEQEPVSHEFDKDELTRRASLDTSGWSFITRAFAQSGLAGSKILRQKSFVRTLSKSGDQSGKSRINDYFQTQKGEIAPVSTSILSDPAIPDREKLNYLETLLQLPVAERPKTPEFLKVLVPYVTHQNFNIRRNAARILRAADYVNQDVVTAFENYFRDNKEKLSAIPIEGRNYSAQYLAVAAGRDIFYNKGIRETNDLRRNFTRLNKTERRQQLSRAIKSFMDGQKYARYAPENRRVLFSKLHYGISLAWFNEAIAEYTVRKSNPKSALELRNAILSETAKGTILPSNNPLASKAKSAFKAFLTGLGKNAPRYSWQHHIQQAKNCLSSNDGLAFDCMQKAKSS